LRSVLGTPVTLVDVTRFMCFAVSSFQRRLLASKPIWLAARAPSRSSKQTIERNGKKEDRV